MALYLVRHGEDGAASEGRFGDEGLSERGRAQARGVSDSLRSVQFRVCLASPLARARETAEAILQGREIPMEISPNLAEGAIGNLAGMTLESAREKYPNDFAVGHTLVARLAATARTAPGGETRDAFMQRAGLVCDRLREELAFQGTPVLVVAHGGLFNYALQLLFGLPLRDEAVFGFDYCGVVRVIAHSEQPGFGPFPMLRFGSPADSLVVP